jgi:molybdenum cofactor cytidylyltransferase
VLVHSAWSEGIGSSIAFGVEGLPKETSAVLILLCDQVAVTETDLNALVDCYKNNLHKDAPSIVCAKYAGRFGVPAIFPRAFFPQLMSLAGDVGAKKILEQNAVVDVCMDHAVIDIDTQENLIQFIHATSAGKEQRS